ncbi:MAG: extracellular solute-binding protein [Oscillospiraceae bacterium]|jgi:multiple sugar transport system substrate-binding protein|nr:extracellular solute-binding protein [Oscillospiraceae bacterium]
MKKIALFVAVCLLAAALAGCGGSNDPLDPKNPVTVTMWHNFGGVMKETIDALIDEFNNSIGRERGVIINVTSIGASKEQNEKLAMIAAGDPGAPDMPDIVTAYPAMALTLSDSGHLAELDGYFTERELAAYVPQFVAEGRLFPRRTGSGPEPSDGKLYVFPISKSTEALFVNKTLFDRFAAETGAALGTLSTFEGLAKTAVQYYEWTDARTPDVPDDGKAFFTADSWFNIAQVGTAQLGGEFVGAETLNTGAGAFGRIWDFSVYPAVTGGYAVTDGYSSDLSKTGDIVCSLGSTAGVLFYGDSVTYPDNTVESVEYVVLPYPVFEGGRSVALQRGAGMVIARSDPRREYAAVLFLKWFTAAEQNMRLVAQTGYLPVTREAFEEKMAGEIEAVNNSVVKRLLETATRMYEEYDFIVAPNVDNFAALSGAYEADIRQAMRIGRQQVLDGDDADAVNGKLLEAFQ